MGTDKRPEIDAELEIQRLQRLADAAYAKTVRLDYDNEALIASRFVENEIDAFDRMVASRSMLSQERIANALEGLLRYRQVTQK